MPRIRHPGLLAAALLSVAPAFAAPPLESGIQLQHFDQSVAPQDDFYRHVNGGWLKHTEIPADRSVYSAFSELDVLTQDQLKAIIFEAVDTEAGPGEPVRQVGDMYQSFMDEAAVERAGLSGLAADLRMIDRLSHKEEIPALMAHLERLGVAGLHASYVYRDAKQPDRYTLYFDQAGLGLPNREYYLEDDKKFLRLRQQYSDYIERLLSLAGTTDSTRIAPRLLELETALAKEHWTPVQNRDAQKTYNPYRLEELPGLNWSAYLEQAGIHSIDSVIVSQPSYFESLDEAIANFPLDLWREFFRLRLLDSFAPYLDAAFVQAHFDFHARQLNGVDELRPRWKRGVDAVEFALGEALGQLYVQRHFPAEAKQRMQALVARLIEAYRLSIQDLDWMSADTKAQALEKLASFRPKIGYPERWKDYSGLQIKTDDLLGNIRRARLFQHAEAVEKLGKPADPQEWHMTPQTVNAYYSPTANEIVFPAAILQAPFFNLKAEDAINYGAIGAVIGHEIGHGFDDQGSRYDGQGRLRNWWTDEDRQRFEERTARLIEQYNAYEALPGYFVNGELTIGENIGDLGGLSIAAQAYHLSLDGKAGPKLDGYSAQQRLFIGWAQIWRRLYKDEALINRIKNDPHSPGEYRCNGIVRNINAFYEAFALQPEHALYLPPEQRVSIW